MKFSLCIPLVFEPSCLKGEIVSEDNIDIPAFVILSRVVKLVNMCKPTYSAYVISLFLSIIDDINGTDFAYQFNTYIDLFKEKNGYDHEYQLINGL